MNPIVTLIFRELLTVPRKKHFWGRRLAFVVLVAWCLGASIDVLARSFSLPVENSRAGLEIFKVFMTIAFVAICLLVPNDTAALLAREKENRTLGLLFLTSLTPAQVIGAKWIRSIWTLLFTVLSCLPLLLAGIQLGGVSGEQIVVAMVLLLSFLCFTAALGLCFSALCSTTHRARNLSLGGLGLYLLLPWLGVLLTHELFSFNSDALEDLCYAFSPIAALGFANEGNRFALCWWNIVWQFAASAFLLWAASRGLHRRRFQEGLPAQTPKGKLARMVSSSLRGKAPALEGNPVAWHDFYKVYGGWRSCWIRLGLIGFCTLAALILIQSDSEGELVGVLSFSFWLVMLICIFAVIGQCSKAFTVEKERQTLENLLISGLTDGQIVGGKIVAILLHNLAYFLWLLFSGFFILFNFLGTTSSYSHLDDILFVLAMIFANGAALAALALYMSLRTPRDHSAMRNTIAMVILWYIGTIVLFSFIREAPGFLYLCCLLGMTLYFLRRTVKDLRKYAMQ